MKSLTLHGIWDIGGYSRHGGESPGEGSRTEVVEGENGAKQSGGE